LVNKFKTLNTSASAFPVQPTREQPEPNDKEAEEQFFRGVKSLDNGDPKKAVAYFNNIVDKNFNNKRMVYIMISIAYR
jgi:hypothetical protein